MTDFPTLHGRKNSTKPDLVLANNKIRHNTSTTTGPITKSDHILIIMKVTAKTITKPIPTRLYMKRANWEQFKQLIGNNISSIEISYEQRRHRL